MLSLMSNDLLCCNLESVVGLNHMIHVDYNCQQKIDGFLLQAKLSKAKLPLVAEMQDGIKHTAFAEFITIVPQYIDRHPTHKQKESASPPPFPLPYGTELIINTNPLASPGVALS